MLLKKETKQTKQKDIYFIYIYIYIYIGYDGTLRSYIEVISWNYESFFISITYPL